MKCQACDRPATNHVTEIVAGEPVEYHVCETHFLALDNMESVSQPASAGPGASWHDPRLSEALHNPAAREALAAYLLPALCLALLDPKPDIRIGAAWHLLRMGQLARSASGALRDALNDPDERVRKASRLALAFIDEGRVFLW